MAAKKRNIGDHSFGGKWTSDKLDVLSDYLRAYTTALKSQPFRLEYVDAFAGTGYRTQEKEPLFTDIAEGEPQEFLAGSAMRALNVVPPFSKYVFVDSKRSHVESLKKIQERHPLRQIEVHNEDANAFVQDYCKGEWRNRRAVMFLDPYGMNVSWDTLCAIANTKAIDLWLLFPLGMGVSRLLQKNGNIEPKYREKLNELLGTDEWYDRFYQRHTSQISMFLEESETVTKASNEVIGQYFVERLGKIFAGVAANPLVMPNSKKCPLYLFCFAASNPKGATIALKIATHILGKPR